MGKTTRAVIVVDNSANTSDLILISKWSNEGDSDWNVPPADVVAGGCGRFELNSNHKAGFKFRLFIGHGWHVDYHMSFTCPGWSRNSAEGSEFAGLQSYSRSGTPVEFTYRVGTPNLASWDSGNTQRGEFFGRRWLFGDGKPLGPEHGY